MRALLVIFVAMLLLQGCGEKTTSSRYLDEDSYHGDEKAIIGLINSRIKYISDDDLESYMKLFVPDSPINGMPKYKIQTVRLTGEFKIGKYSNYSLAVVPTEEVFEEYGATNLQYVFIKMDGANEEWKIADID
ncbi:hypothetical protein [Cohnella terricola]|uniref:DUF4829 domain-containing protein n=1 Tax=Cohnella terricola TaxID=1289167 RepID=A0A559J616_9BACL|nr:hypothetical protein [Cohnella terricola]TVX95327.1 hypothetical protein FPZ45_23795 [Cohnella terricola]